MVEDFDALGAELLQTDTYDTDKGLVAYFNLVFLSDFVKGRLFRNGRFRLRDQYTLHVFRIFICYQLGGLSYNPQYQKGEGEDFHAAKVQKPMQN